MAVRRRLRRDLEASTVDAIGFSLMVGLGETYVPAFALAVGLGEVASGWVVTLPLLGGALLQLVSPPAVRALGSRRSWVVACAALQAVSLLGYVAGAITGTMSAWLLFAVATLYWAAGLATGPAWNAWIGALVPRRLRATFFARRSRFAQAGVLVGLVAGGLALDAGKRSGVLLATFAGLFALAALCRGISACLLRVQSEAHSPEGCTRSGPATRRVAEEERHGRREAAEPATERSKQLEPSPFGWLRGARGGSDRRLLVYMLAVQTALQFSGPFFTPYMLEQLEFNYIEYLVLIGTSFAVKAIVMPTVGALASRIGTHRLLHIAGFGIVPLSALWAVSGSFAWIMAVQIVSGSIWAIYELCTFLLLFEHIKESERTSVLTGFNLANAIAMVAGALAGGAVLHAMGTSRAGYFTLFIGSGVLRLVSLVFLARLTRATFVPGPLAVGSLGVRPNAGSVDAPIVASILEEMEPGETAVALHRVEAVATQPVQSAARRRHGDGG